MNTTHSSLSDQSTLLGQTITTQRPSRLISWGAVFAGCFAALGTHIVLTMLGLGFGLRMIQPATNDNPITDFGVTAGIVWAVSALIALAVGGWVAGRSINVGEKGSGGLHGFVVWSLATVVMFTFLSGGAGGLVGGASKLVGKGVSATASVAQSPMQDVVKDLSNEVALPNGQPVSAIAKREVLWSATRFATNPSDPQRRSDLVTSLDNAGVPRDSADKMVTTWQTSIERAQKHIQQAKDDAAAAARQAADRSAEAISHAALWTFLGFIIGALTSILGGRMGAKSALAAPFGQGSLPEAEDV